MRPGDIFIVFLVFACFAIVAMMAVHSRRQAPPQQPQPQPESAPLGSGATELVDTAPSRTSSRPKRRRG